MPTYRVMFEDIRVQAKEEGTYFFARPRGDKWNQLRDTGSMGNFVLVQQSPLVIRYGNTVYTIARDHIEVDVPDDTINSLDGGEVGRGIFLSVRLAGTMATFGMVNLPRILHRVKRHKWINGVLTKIDKDSDTFGRPLIGLAAVTFPFLMRALRYIFRNPRVSETITTNRLEESLGISKGEVKDTVSRLLSEGLVERVEVDKYPESMWPLLAVRLVVEGAPGQYTRTSLSEKLRLFGLTNRESRDAVDEAVNDGSLTTKKRRLDATIFGIDAIRQISKPKKVVGLLVTKLGRDKIFGR